jgi:DNA polymerase-3 subunit epsilon
MLLFITDTETTGLNPQNDELIEAAGILYDVKSKSQLATIQYLRYSSSNAAQSTNNISQESLDASRIIKTDLAKVYLDLAEEADYIVAHNASFDKGFVHKYIGTTSKRWICTKNDIKFPQAGKSKRLGHIAYDHNIPVIGAHRGLADVNIIVSLFNIMTDLEDQINGASVAKKTYISLTEFHMKDRVKAAGFNWNPSAKRWEKSLTEKEASESEAVWGFKVKELV